jgi:hypothetical protein
LISGDAFWALFAATHERVTSEANPLRLSVIRLTPSHSLLLSFFAAMISASEKSVVEELGGNGHARTGNAGLHVV